MTTRLEIASLGFHDVTDDPFLSGFQRSGAMPFKHAVAGFARDLDAIGAAPVAPQPQTFLSLGSGWPKFTPATSEGSNPLYAVSALAHAPVTIV